MRWLADHPAVRQWAPPLVGIRRRSQWQTRPAPAATAGRCFCSDPSTTPGKSSSLALLEVSAIVAGKCASALMAPQLSLLLMISERRHVVVGPSSRRSAGVRRLSGGRVARLQGRTYLQNSCQLNAVNSNATLSREA